MNESDELAAFDMHSRTELETLAREGLVTDSLKSLQRELRQGVETFVKTRAEIRSDKNLSEQGRQAAIAKAKEQLAAHLDAFETTRLAPQVPAIDAVRTELAAKADPVPEPSAADIEWVSMVSRDFDITERGALYLAAPPAVRRAMELARPVPKREGTTLTWEPVVAPQDVENLRASQLRDLDPVLTKRLRALERPHQVLSGLARVTRGLLRNSPVR